ncbi:hypothetical protein ACWEOR_18320, partial [Micromonospora chalcea]
DAGLPIVGDDIKSQVGATIVHRALAKLFEDRGDLPDGPGLATVRTRCGPRCRTSRKPVPRNTASGAFDGCPTGRTGAGPAGELSRYPL